MVRVSCLPLPFCPAVADGPALDAEMAKFILSKVGDKFCELVEQEKEARMQVKGWKEFSGSDCKLSLLLWVLFTDL